MEVEAEVLRFLYAEIEKLPVQSKQVFKLFYLRQLTIQQIAKKMNLQYQTVANHKVYALKVLRLKIFDSPALVIILCMLLAHGALHDSILTPSF
jgi:RNA polymerase sigma-70 factor (ECF subfamily)